MRTAVFYNWEEVKTVLNKDPEGPKGSVCVGRDRRQTEKQQTKSKAAEIGRCGPESGLPATRRAHREADQMWPGPRSRKHETRNLAFSWSSASLMNLKDLSNCREEGERMLKNKPRCEQDRRSTGA